MICASGEYRLYEESPPDERRARDRLQHRPRFRHARRAEVVARRARGDDEEVEARFREADEIGERSAPGRGEGDRDHIGVNVLHVRSVSISRSG